MPEKTIRPAVAQDDYTLTIVDVAILADSHQRTVRRWTEVGLKSRGLLPAVQTVHGLRFSSKDVNAYIRIKPVVPARRATDTAIEDAVAAGKLAGEKLAQTRLTNTQRNMVATVVDSFRFIGGASA